MKINYIVVTYKAIGYAHKLYVLHQNNYLHSVLNLLTD